MIRNKRNVIIIGLLIVGIILVVNSGELITGSFITDETDKPIITIYHYTSSDYGFEDVEIPQKGRTLEMVEAGFDDYVRTNDLDDVKLMIASRPNEWDDLNHRRWDYEFMEKVE